MPQIPILQAELEFLFKLLDLLDPPYLKDTLEPPRHRHPPGPTNMTNVSPSDISLLPSLWELHPHDPSPIPEPRPSEGITTPTNPLSSTHTSLHLADYHRGDGVRPIQIKALVTGRKPPGLEVRWDRDGTLYYQTMVPFHRFAQRWVMTYYWICLIRANWTRANLNTCPHYRCIRAKQNDPAYDQAAECFGLALRQEEHHIGRVWRRTSRPEEWATFRAEEMLQWTEIDTQGWLELSHPMTTNSQQVRWWWQMGAVAREQARQRALGGAATVTGPGI